MYIALHAQGLALPRKLGSSGYIQFKSSKPSTLELPSKEAPHGDMGKLLRVRGGLREEVAAAATRRVRLLMLPRFLGVAF